ncbi:disulfide isomerase DsbC N-terminal domain-containing protein [Psychrobacter sp. JCM 18900]|uniref:disulfide isomerase DsbC N-terminal domain-containing protein n=1 Tax=Psychrobacter sp. JCM 18900 TaxID=1298608 RepID=UPI000434F270|nr:disulfide isomerase DsbC N-terminal domain-containing protein [Psychrobacter sp. JCM 18900]GAF51622.1 thiol:disulfide interchange protein DsbC [Psychrobacter sp. JCM 18900]
MTLPVLKSASLISVILLATTACAQPSSADANSNNVTQSTTNSQVAQAVSATVDKRLRQILTQAGIKTQITSIVPSKLPNMYQVNLAGQLPLHITEDGRYVIQGELQKNPSKQVVTKTPVRSTSAQVGEPVNTSVKSDMLANMAALKNMSAKTPFFYTAVPGVIWGATLEGVPFLLSDDAQYITDGEISVIENGQFIGLDENFEKRKNQSVFASLDKSQLITYPATTTERAVIYVADDVNCPYCRRLHQQVPSLNAKGVTVNVIGYPIYEASPKQMRGIWCQANEDSRRQAFDKAMLTGEMTPASASCTVDHVTPNREKAAGLAVMATPAIYREDGVLYQASFESPEFLEFLGVE